MSEACGHQHGACCSSHDHPAHEAHPAKGHAHAEEACGCHGGVPVFDGVDPRYKRVLWTVILINAAMFVTEIVAGHLARSQALQADALDFLGDTVTYGLSLAVIGGADPAAGLGRVPQRRYGCPSSSRVKEKARQMPGLHHFRIGREAYFLARSIASTIRRRASSASPQRMILAHLPGSRSL